MKRKTIRRRRIRAPRGPRSRPRFAGEDSVSPRAQLTPAGRATKIDHHGKRGAQRLSDLGDLSVEEIRERYIDGTEPVTARLLARLHRGPRQGVQRLYALLRKRF